VGKGGKNVRNRRGETFEGKKRKRNCLPREDEEPNKTLV